MIRSAPSGRQSFRREALWVYWRNIDTRCKRAKLGGRLPSRGRPKLQPEISGHDQFGRPIRRVVVTDIEIPFWSVVGLLIQLALAAIPAALILGLMYAAVKWLLMFLATLAPVRH